MAGDLPEPLRPRLCLRRALPYAGPPALPPGAAARTDALYLWTHYVDIDALPPGDQRRTDWNTTGEVRSFAGEPVRLFRRSYVKANETAEFCGGVFDDHRWMARADILKVLGLLGLTQIDVAHDDHSSPFGPSFSVFARRP